MKKVFIIFILVAAAFVSCYSGTKYDSTKSGVSKTIAWAEVNARLDHDVASEVKKVLHNGDIVTLTGNEYHVIGSDDLATNDWIEIKLRDGKVLWVVQQSIRWH